MAEMEVVVGERTGGSVKIEVTLSKEEIKKAVVASVLPTFPTFTVEKIDQEYNLSGPVVLVLTTKESPDGQ
jgi:hypothetical protein